MKFILIALFFTSITYADGIQRIETIVEDIAKLRTYNEECEENKYNNMSNISVGVSTSISRDKQIIPECNLEAEKVEKQKSLPQNKKEALVQNSDAYAALVRKKNNLEKKIKELKKKLQKEKKLCKIKDYGEKNFEKSNKEKKAKTKEKTSFNLKNLSRDIICKEDNYFPKLMMKKKYQNTIPISEKIISFKATSFHLKDDSNIYDYPNKNIVDRWEKNRTFTSNKKTLDWIKISGKFLDKRWTKVRDALWIKKDDVIKKIVVNK